MGVLEGKYLVASGPVIIEDGKLLVNKDTKDDFYKIPGGSINEDELDLEKACKRKVKEEINGEIEIIKPLHPKVLWENPQTKEKMTIVLVSYLAKLKNKEIVHIPIDQFSKESLKIIKYIHMLAGRNKREIAHKYIFLRR